MNRQIQDTQLNVQVPAHLKPFVVEQNYSQYTPIDQAVWRFVMRLNHHYLSQTAHSAYLNGMFESGMDVEAIPRIEYMNECLSRIGWGAVTVDGFIPPAAFMDFQGQRILAISADIRTHEHIAYTPAPDIIHEAAGHAPIILDEKYREYLQKIGELGAKAFSSKQDLDVYEAIRYLSQVKEDPSVSQQTVEAAELQLQKAVQAVTESSEAALVSRMHWWTVEYGLIGDVNSPKIYGAGLLSSAGESRSCLQEDVTKMPFSLDACIATDYDITKPQPQLFVCESFDQLIEAVDELASRLSCTRGGTYGLTQALKSGAPARLTSSSGLQVTGIVGKIWTNDAGEAVYFQTNGPTQLGHQGQVLVGHGTDYHSEGFSSPIGKLEGIDTPIECLTSEEREQLGLSVGKETALHFRSGVHVAGKLVSSMERDGRLILLSFEKCRIELNGEILFQSDSGVFDLAVCSEIVSAVPAFELQIENDAAEQETSSKKLPEYTEKEIQLHHCYQSVRDLRLLPEAERKLDHAEWMIQEILQQLNLNFPNDWLLRMEILEITRKWGILSAEAEKLEAQLRNWIQNGHSDQEMMEAGLQLIASC